MGKSDTAAKVWFRNKTRFADLFNGTIFNGEQLIRPEELELVEGEADVLITDKNKKTKAVQKYRDVVMRWKNGVKFVILACENQDKIHYAMPVRTMLYDSMSYVNQMKKLWEEQGRKGITQEEFLSRFRKEDSLAPVITIVFYYGETEWDASLDLHEMIKKNIPETLWEKISDYIPNYHINLVDPKNMEKFEKFQTDLQQIFNMLQYKNDKDALLKYVMQNREYFENVDVETYYAIKEFLHSEKILKKVMSDKKEDSVNMCKALQDLYEEGIEQGRKEAEENMSKALQDLYKEGVEQGRKEVEENMSKALQDSYEEGVESGRKEVEENMSKTLKEAEEKKIKAEQENARLMQEIQRLQKALSEQEKHC